ncbi:mannan endo-1-6-alpha-mannosidase [Penicillium angulare]|uniref:Mannan endo-1,6-alpha-mannosidase n=1 Tax=Penicillium angulare TaxID=116970 RepID=A0A9W9K982_9EURO|nr:mannan endo-1-6-alpha-mannosidase [Penicillium angulare]
MRITQFTQIATAILPGLLFSDYAQALTINLEDQDSLVAAAKVSVEGAFGYYNGNNSGATPGAFDFSWWEGAALCNAFLNYWHFTGDETYNYALNMALSWQAGDAGDYLNENYTTYCGNDDQMQWGNAAMAAAEYNLSDPIGIKYSWIGLVQGVYNNQKDNNEGWDDTTCGGGFRWQKLPVQGTGYHMKNAVSNGGFFQLAARLAQYLQKDEYADWAEKTYNWSTSVGLVNEKTWAVGDSVSTGDNCKTVDPTNWSYNYGVYLNGCAYMYAYTKKSIWLDRLNGLIDSTMATFFLPKYGGTISEKTCEAVGNNCDRNQKLFKGLTLMWMANVALVVPETYDKLLKGIQDSATGAAISCSGQGNKTCGDRWYSGYDGKIGMEEQISATNAFSVALLPFVKNSSAPLNTLTGGNSSSNPNAGTTYDNGLPKFAPITTGDRAGAGIMTAVFVGGMVGMAVFMLMGP